MPPSSSTRWRTLHGSTFWEGLIDPLDADLRRIILDYGELTQATYNGFSRSAGDCLYQKENLLSETGVANASLYRVTKFLYATSSLHHLGHDRTTTDPPSSSSGVTTIQHVGGSLLPCLSMEEWFKESNWMGYIAVATDAGKEVLGRRDIVVAWRGTKRPMEWMVDLQFSRDSSGSILLNSLLKEGEKVHIHHGWVSIYHSRDQRSIFNKNKSAREQDTTALIGKSDDKVVGQQQPGNTFEVLEEVNRLIRLYEDEDISITTTGHSTLSAIDIVANVTSKLKMTEPTSTGKGRVVPVTAIVFASPRVGDGEFRKVFHRTSDLRLLRVTNAPDIIPRLPLRCPFLGKYEDVGVELSIDTRKSSMGCLESPRNLGTWHSMKVYLRGVLAHQRCDSDHLPPSWLLEKKKRR